jgi:Rnl2 family RNA ligase
LNIIFFKIYEHKPCIIKEQMPFIKYPSIPCMKNALKQRKFRSQGEENWTLTEKIHGANFQVIVDDGKVSFGSRRLLLDYEQKSKDFYNYSELIVPLTRYALALAKLLDVTALNIYGELYGGNIQKEITYQAKPQFSVFDVLASEKVWIDYENFDIVSKAGFSVVPMKFGTLKELIQTPVEFCSIFSEKKQNAEGYVIKKVVLEYKTSYSSGCLRLAVKNKAPTFIEAHTGKKTAERSYEINNQDPLQNFPYLKYYVVNKNRVSAWYSKGNILENPKKVTAGVIADAISDYASDHSSEGLAFSELAFSEEKGPCLHPASEKQNCSKTAPFLDEKALRTAAYSMFQEVLALVKEHNSE